MAKIDLYKKYGSFVKKSGVRFCVYAPHAIYVSVLGDFNGYDKDANPMQKDEDGNWKVSVKKAKEGETYKYFIVAEDGREFLKADPYARYAEVKPNSASKIFESKYKFKDEAWLKQRAKTKKTEQPISIYEVHLASWQRSSEGEYLTYKEIAKKLVKYVKKANFTHIELLPISEHPFDGSWGYQTTGYFAPTSRFGTPDEFKYFVDAFHKEGIGVILDWVPSHFATDGHGLIAFDGTALYEHPDSRRGYHPEWKSNIFDYGSEYVKSFLISSALWWLEEYHIDGLRVDAVASMLYLDYARENGEWEPNIYGGNLNLEAIGFLKELNKSVHKRHEDVLTAAEESTAFLGVTHKGEGLGFDFKWNMGWMHDTLRYFKLDPIHRQHHHHELTFMFWYSFEEDYVLPLSHDEVVHMKGSLVNKMSGLYDWKFAHLRAMYGFMYAFVGKKLLFMGDEFGQFNEWHYESELDWSSLDFPAHSGLLKYVSELNKLYKTQKALWFDKKENFEWCNKDDYQNNVIVFERIYKEERIVVVCNFSGQELYDYFAPVSKEGKYTLLLNSQQTKFFGEDGSRKKTFVSHPFAIGEKSHVLRLDIKPLCVEFFKLQENI
jgi:1,4-alpha-glucan branching enzyme